MSVTTWVIHRTLSVIANMKHRHLLVMGDMTTRCSSAMADVKRQRRNVLMIWLIIFWVGADGTKTGSSFPHWKAYAIYFVLFCSVPNLLSQLRLAYCSLNAFEQINWNLIKRIRVLYQVNQIQNILCKIQAISSRPQEQRTVSKHTNTS